MPLRVGVVGLGQMGSVHASIVARTAGLSLAAVADVDVDRARDVAQRLGVSQWTSDYAELVASSLDFVIVATPDHLHREPAVTLLSAGVPLLLEKSMAHTREDAVAIASISASRGVPLMVGHTYRFDPQYAMIREAIMAGSIGRPLSAYGRQSITARDDGLRAVELANAVAESVRLGESIAVARE
jgi:predicted dehydrogenase